MLIKYFTHYQIKVKINYLLIKQLIMCNSYENNLLKIIKDIWYPLLIRKKYR